MMNEAGDSGMQVDSDGSRPRKRPRRAGERMERAPVGEEKEKDDVRDIQEIESSPIPPERPLYTVEDDSESDLEFEDVELGGASAEETDTLPEPMKGQEEGFSVVARRPEANTPSKARRRRKPVTSAERLVRLAIHKMHILYLLYHVFYRNHWCNDEVAQVCVHEFIYR
jgi:xeroderma pigmentosum group C-complementing protein